MKEPCIYYFSEANKWDVHLRVSKILDNLRRLLKEFKILKYYDGKNLEMVWEER